MKEPAHLLRGAFYVLLLLAVCAIRFAFGQRNSGTQSTVGNPMQLPTTSSDSDRSLRSITSQPMSPGPTATSTATATPTPTCLPSVTPGPWLARAPLPVNLARYAFAQVGDAFYVISGVSDGSVVNTTYKYDGATNSWTTLAPIPVGSEAPAAAYYDGKIYVAPGLGQTGFYIYDVDSNTWSAGATYPGSGYGAAAGAFGGVFITVGGYSGGFIANTWVYDVIANFWSPGPNAPSAYGLGGYKQVGRNLYMIGSFGNTPAGPLAKTNAVPDSSIQNVGANIAAPAANSTTSMRLDLLSVSFSTGPTWTMQRADMALAYDPSTDKLYAIGGDTTGGGYFDSSAEVDELAIGSWPFGTWVVSMPALPSFRQADQAGFYGTGYIWSTGGFHGPTCCTFLNENLYRNNGGCPSPTPTATPTSTPTATPTTTPMPSSTPTATPTPTATARPTPAPRPRPSPPPRPQLDL